MQRSVVKRLFVFGVGLWPHILATTPSLTGFFVDASVGGARHSLTEGIRGKEGTRDDQVQVVQENRWGVAGAFGLGYGFAFQNGLYLDCRGLVVADLTEIKETDIHKTFTDTQISLDGGKAKIYEGSYSLLAKPFLTYGVHLHLGFRVFPNLLATFGMGLEWTSTTLTQQINAYAADGTFGFFVPDGVFKPLKDVETTSGVKISTTSSRKSPEVSVRHRHWVPNLGAKLFLSPHLFAFVDIAVRLGSLAKLPESAFDKTNSFTKQGKDEENPTEFTGQNLSSLGASLHVQPKTGLRLCVGLGWKL